MRDYADLTVVLDRSGSMHACRQGTIDGFNKFLADQKAVPGEGCWTLVQFDDQYQIDYAQVDQRDVSPLSVESYGPRGGTALYDAICRTIDDTGRRLAALPEYLRPNKVMVVIITDGYENTSRTFNKHHVNERIAHQRDKYGWQFLFLGANQDAIATATSLGMARSSALSWIDTSYGGTLCAYDDISKGVRHWKLDGNQSVADLLTPADVKVDVAVKVGG